MNNIRDVLLFVSLQTNNKCIMRISYKKHAAETNVTEEAPEESHCAEQTPQQRQCETDSPGYLAELRTQD